ncbi:MAG: DEAD/DEAH box helicase [Gammaproteobacteria bacterium]|nr:DEAD/DEAH box helicase [Gammaproteobacteria bacterium]
MSAESSTPPAFSDLGLAAAVLKTIDEIGYETPSPIQAQTIPHLLAGRDVLGQAQTGTGKTAAFALPILSRIDLQRAQPQVLVLAPTRELAIQVAEAFQHYAHHMPGLHVLPIYGGQDYRTQLKQLNRGVHIVVGTPGRVMDHMRRGTLKLDGLRTLVLDEADEMLRMGFIDDVEWVLEQSPPSRQIALFSATMPDAIRRIANKHLNDPAVVTIKLKTTTAETIRQRYWYVSGLHKLDALTRILEAEEFDGIIIFVRTKIITEELAEKLQARGHATAALNGDIAQAQREKTVDALKSGKIDIIVATDVAARGLDVARISHVINYDVPHDTESYVHRIGRTGRAGRKGDAILFIAPREKRMLSAIEHATRQKIEEMQLPTTEVINDKRIAAFKQRITDTIAAADGLGFCHQLVEQYEQEHNVPAIEIAAALARLLQGSTPLLLEKETRKPREQRSPREQRPQHEERSRDNRADFKKKPRASDANMDSYRIAVGHAHGVQPGNIVGAIANEAGLDSSEIGRIKIFDDYSIVDLPKGMPKETFLHLKNTRVAGQRLNIAKQHGISEKKTDFRKGSPAAKTKPGDKAKPGRTDKTGGKPKDRAGKKNKPHRKGGKPGAA